MKQCCTICPLQLGKVLPSELAVCLPLSIFCLLHFLLNQHFYATIHQSFQLSDLANDGNLFPADETNIDNQDDIDHFFRSRKVSTWRESRETKRNINEHYFEQTNGHILYGIILLYTRYYSCWVSLYSSLFSSPSSRHYSITRVLVWSPFSRGIEWNIS